MDITTQHLCLALLCSRQPGPSAAIMATRTGSGQAGNDAFPDECPFELRKGAQHAQEQLAFARRGIHLCSDSFEDTQANLALLEVLEDFQQMYKRPCHPVQLPDHQGVAGMQRFEARRQPWPCLLRARGNILISGPSKILRRNAMLLK